MTILFRILRVLALFCLANYLLVFTELVPLGGWPAGAALIVLLLCYLAMHICPRRAKGATRRLRALLGGYELLLVSFLSIGGDRRAVDRALADRRPGYVPARRARMDADRGRSASVRAGDRAADRKRFFSACSSPANGCASCGARCCCSRGGCRCSTCICSTACCTPRAAKYYFECAGSSASPCTRKTRTAARATRSCWCTASFSATGSTSTTGAASRRPCRNAARRFTTAASSRPRPWRRLRPSSRRASRRCWAETGADKVNLIAHSKGGLDSRYAISCLALRRMSPR